jgi:hypothetical protein
MKWGEGLRKTSKRRITAGFKAMAIMFEGKNFSQKRQ